MKFELPLPVLKVIQELQKANFEVYVVGGSVRDLIMKRPVYDWDFTTSATPQQILKAFPDGFYDNKFGTVGLSVEDLVKKYDLTDKDLKSINSKIPFEVTTYRSEDGYKDRRHPDKVEWGKTVTEDLKRRDFTINAIALKTNGELKLIDPFKGQGDIKAKLIRAVGNPEKRFSEDALRLMRAIRIAAELGFTIETETLQAISKNHKLLSSVSWERIRDELLRILKSQFPAEGIKFLYTTNLLKVILPEIIELRGIKQAGHHTKDVWNHSLDSLASCPSPDPIVRLATFLHDIGKAKAYREKNEKITFYGHEVVGERLTKKIADRFKLPKKDKELLLILVRQHMFAYQPEMTDSAIRRFIRKVGKENINNMMMLRIGDRLGGGSRATSWRLRELQQRIGEVMYTPMQINDLKVNGRDVMKTLNIKSGPKVGKILESLFEEVLEDANKNKKDYLLKRIKDYRL